MLTRGELAAALKGLLRLTRFETDGFHHFDASLDGFWKSFWAAALALPVWALLQAEQMAAAHPAAPLRYAALQSIAYAVGWLAYPLLMVRISRFLDRQHNYFRYMVAYNWFQLVEAAAWLPLLVLIGSQAPADLIALVWLATHAALFAYGWFIARHGLEIEGTTAGALVIIDFLLGLLIDGVTNSLL